MPGGDCLLFSRRQSVLTLIKRESNEVEGGRAGINEVVLGRRKERRLEKEGSMEVARGTTRTAKDPC